MPMSWALLAAILLAVAGFLLGRSRAHATAAQDVRTLHSRPAYHGASVGLAALLPALAVLAAGAILRLAGVLSSDTGPIIGIVALIGATLWIGSRS